MYLRSVDFIKRHIICCLSATPPWANGDWPVGLLRETCLNGHCGGFYNAQTLLDELYTSLADHSTSRLIKKARRLNPLMLDELSHMTLKPEQANVFFRVMDQRHHVSTIITTNVDPEEMVHALPGSQSPERLARSCAPSLHHARIEGPSLRSPEDEKARAALAASRKA
jgi:DNA replication protein DnaC